MNPEGVMFYLADHVDDGRLPDHRCGSRRESAPRVRAPSRNSDASRP
jgi:hypothetical protein